MKKIFIFILMITILSCKKEKKQERKKQIIKVDNAELLQIYEDDQNDRKRKNINWKEVSKRDSLRRIKVNNLFDSNNINTASDFKNAAMVFQHGNSSNDYEKAVQFIKKAIELDSTTNKWLLAATTDRYLLSIGEPQIYGTQYHKTGNEPWVIAKMDSTKVSDTERIEYGVETLAAQKEKLKQMNSENNGHDH